MPTVERQRDGLVCLAELRVTSAITLDTATKAVIGWCMCRVVGAWTCSSLAVSFTSLVSRPLKLSAVKYRRQRLPPGRPAMSQSAAQLQRKVFNA